MDRSQAEARVGETIDRYRLEGVLGFGGFGAVFRARHVVMDRLVAVKLLHGSMGDRAEVRERFLREARTLGRLGHPNVVAVHDSGIANTGEAFVVMELLEGEDLAARAERLGRLSLDETLRITDAVLDGLASAHAAGIVHRDLKPANVFLSRNDEVKLVDFGISKLEDERMTRTGLVLGTPVYMAPECFVVGAAGVDARADLYAVGVMLYELLSGRLPYEAPSYEALVLKVATEAPAPFASVAPSAPPALASLIDRAMARIPSDRFEGAPSMRAALASLRHGPFAATSFAPPSDAFAATAHLPATPAPAYAPAMAASAMPAGAYSPPTPTPYYASGAPHGTAAPSVTHGASPARTLQIVGALFGALGLAGLATAAYLFTRPADHGPRQGLAQGMIAPETHAAAPVEPVPVAVPAKPLDPVDVAPAPSEETPRPPKEEAAEVGASIDSASTSGKPTGHANRTGVRMHEPNVIGEAPVDAIHDRFEGARHALDRCRRDVDERVYVQLMIHDGRIALAGPNPNERSSDDEVARCVANVFRSDGPFPSGQGIVQIAFDLDAR